MRPRPSECSHSGNGSLEPILKIDVFKRKHAPELFLRRRWESAPFSKLRCVFVRAEDSIPKRNVAEIEGMHVVLMVYRMKFRCLDEVSEASWGSHVGVVEIFSGTRKIVVPERSEQRTAQHRIQNDCA